MVQEHQRKASPDYLINVNTEDRRNLVFLLIHITKDIFLSETGTDLPETGITRLAYPATMMRMVTVGFVLRI
jgi:hypothetical protein